MRARVWWILVRTRQQWRTCAYRMDSGFVLRKRYVLASEYLLNVVFSPRHDYLV